MATENLKIKDIAKALNMSPSTVCRALQGRYNISEATRKKVEEYANEHKYRPNLFAQSLQNKKTRCIGVVISTVSNTFFSQVLDGIESITRENKYFSIVSQTNESYEQEVEITENMAWRCVDGILVSVSSETQDLSHFRRLQEQGIPVVFFDRTNDEIITHQVSVDNRGGAYDCVNYMLKEGYKRIAHITSPIHLSTTRERLCGYQDALTFNNFAVNENYIKYCPHGGKSMAEINEAFTELMSLPDPPDAIFTASDRITMGCLKIARDNGYMDNHQLNVAGFSNFDMPSILDTSITAIQQPAFEMGQKATELLLELVDRKGKTPAKYFDNKILPTSLITGEELYMMKPLSHTAS